MNTAMSVVVGFWLILQLIGILTSYKAPASEGCVVSGQEVRLLLATAWGEGGGRCWVLRQATAVYFGFFHLSAEHLCQRLRLSVGTTENRMRVAKNPLVRIAWEKLSSPGHGWVGCPVYHCQTPLCPVYFFKLCKSSCKLLRLCVLSLTSCARTIAILGETVCLTW